MLLGLGNLNLAQQIHNKKSRLGKPKGGQALLHS